MEQGFRASLNEIRPLAKKEKSDALQDFESELQEMIEKQAAERGLETESERQIFLLQKEKQRIMRWLRARLKGIDDPDQAEEYEPGARRVVFDGAEYLWERTDGTTEVVTPGMLLTDGIWDVNYALDPKSVPRTVRKKFYIEKAKRLLQRELDKQIAIDQQQSQTSDPRYRGGYKGLVMDRETMSQQGHLAERMVFSYLRKLSLDEDLPFSIEAANVFEDIELSIDFIIKIKKARRGVSVEGTEDDQTIGIQFTIASRRARKLGKLAKAKERAVASGAKVDDIVLVKVPLKQLARLFTAWSVNKPPGGPDAMWDEATKVKILKGVLKGMFSDEEIVEMCAKIAPQNPFEEKVA